MNKEVIQKLNKYIDEVIYPVVLFREEKIIELNDMALKILDYNKKEELIGRHIAEFLSPWTSQEELEKNCIKSLCLVTKTRNKIDVEVITFPVLLLNDDKIYASIIKDISHLRLWEERNIQAERLAAMGKIASEIAHELYNPLGGILLYANILKEDLKDNNFATINLDKIVKLATRCKIIAKGLLNFGKLPSTQYVSMDINQVIFEVFSLIENHLMFKDVDVKFFLDTDLPHFMGDRGGIEQVLLNLIINAGEALAGSGTLIIETTHDKERNGIVIKVKDTGFGIPKEIQHKIFEPFFTTKQNTKGTGLGLAITLAIVKRHNGNITVHSEPGKGTCFEVFLPLCA